MNQPSGLRAGKHASICCLPSFQLWLPLRFTKTPNVGIQRMAKPVRWNDGLGGTAQPKQANPAVCSQPWPISPTDAWAPTSARAEPSFCDSDRAALRAKADLGKRTLGFSSRRSGGLRAQAIRPSGRLAFFDWQPPELSTFVPLAIYEDAQRWNSADGEASPLE